MMVMAIEEVVVVVVVVVEDNSSLFVDVYQPLTSLPAWGAVKG